MTEANSKNPENKLCKIDRTPRGNWNVWKWEVDHWSGKHDWYLQERFKYRWQARSYVRRLLKDKAEYWPK